MKSDITMSENNLVIDFGQLIQNLRNQGLPVIVELGPGDIKTYPNSIGIDIFKKDSVDFICDLTEGFPFIEDNSIDLIYSSHFLEHIDNLDYFLKEINRVLKPGGKKVGVVPHFSNPYYYSDYTHKNFWGMYTLLYFSKDKFFTRDVPRYYNQIDFKINKVDLVFNSPFRGRNLFKKAFGLFVNSSRYTKELYEENLTGICQCYEIRFEIEKK